MPTPAGRVLLSSGTAMRNNRVVDWVFVRWSKRWQFFPTNIQCRTMCREPTFGWARRIQLILLTNAMPNIPQFLNPYKFGLRLNYREGAPLNGLDELKENEWYCKPGKLTGIASGVCNGVKMSCHWNDKDRQRYDLQGQWVHCQVKSHWRICQTGDHIQTDFAQPGDSGSILIDRFGHVCGLLYGATYTYAGINSTTYAGLAMTMPDVLETMKLKIQHPWCLGCIQVTNISILFMKDEMVHSTSDKIY